MEIPVISVSGNPYELGYQHGSQAKDKIRKNVNFYLKLWQSAGDVNRNQVRRDARRFIPYIEKMDSGLIKELEGLAEGSEVQFEEILALNSRWELSLAYIPLTPKKNPRNGCTAFALASNVTQDQHILLGQNWDYKPGLRDSCIILRINQESKSNIIMHTEAGIIGHKGFNSAGMGICINYIQCEREGLQSGVPFWIKVRSILNSDNFSDSMATLMTSKGTNSANLLIAHQEGEIINVECTPDDNFFLYPKEGILVHANHFRSPCLGVKDVGRSTIPDTVIRDRRMFRLFCDQRGDINLDICHEVLKDHFGYPNSICRHRDQRFHPHYQLKTLTSIILDLTDSKMLYTFGPPCSNQYNKITIDKIR